MSEQGLLKLTYQVAPFSNIKKIVPNSVLSLEYALLTQKVMLKMCF